jgi:hypothetical protein
LASANQGCMGMSYVLTGDSSEVLPDRTDLKGG